MAVRTKGFSSVTEPRNGEYCLTAPGVNPTRTAPAVSPVYNPGFAGVPTTVKLYASGTDCRTNQFEVLTQEIQSDGAGGFSEVNSPNLDFTIVVP